MSDTELDALKDGVSCAVVLEQHAGAWKLDKRESTRNCLKYRRDIGGVILVTHQGRGWWDPGSPARGDVVALIQFLQPGLNLGEVRKVLRTLAGMSPSFPAHLRGSVPPMTSTVAERWGQRREIRRGDPAWLYLTGERALPEEILTRAGWLGCIRQGAYGNAWFAHRRDSAVTHVEIRGPTYKGSLRGGTKTLFRFGAAATTTRRLIVFEAPIDALSFAALDGCRDDTAYVATGGGMGPGTIDALKEALARLGAAGGECASATDANHAGDRYAEAQGAMAAEAGVRFLRARPPEGLDWNEVLKKGRRA